MSKFSELNWSEIIRRAIEERLQREVETHRAKNRKALLAAAREQDKIASKLKSTYRGRWSGVEVIRYWREHRYSSSTRQ